MEHAKCIGKMIPKISVFYEKALRSGVTIIFLIMFYLFAVL